MGFRPMPGAGAPDDADGDGEARAELSMLDATLLVLAQEHPADDVVCALRSAAGALGHEFLAVVSLAEVPDVPDLVLGVDPWSVVAIDEPSIDAVRAAFGEASQRLAADYPVEAQGYMLVAVPGFADCLENQNAKRVAWERLKVARHPEDPL